ncbi:competence protein ComJ [cf. Phormidesmis sp. LEGE 11477]|uniref:competence protein ComJ n=1 Tax=cf. Phormidesmis sp. LEGE 11477 TaxID=1828680 RepID=UPI00187E067A|nr:competence protein ComJ [cf. Phormidesmis sp. LEGE 11477]MBE9062943.1 hypothetical protein [cf. Phormidesmis sp. LEGE 11477]
MAELITEVETGGHGSVCITIPPDILPDLPNSDFRLLGKQGFVWYEDFVAFRNIGDSRSYSVKIYLSEELSLQEDIKRSILLPYTVQPPGELLVTGSYGECHSFQITPGKYQLLFESRFMTDQEIAASIEYNRRLSEVGGPNPEFGEEARPQLFIFTFIPTTDEVEAKIIHPTYETLVRQYRGLITSTGFDPRKELVLHHTSRPPGYP